MTICGRINGRTMRLSLAAASLALLPALAGCSYSLNDFGGLGRSSATPAPATTASVPAPPAQTAPPDEHQQAVADAYPSVSLIDILREGTPGLAKQPAAPPTQPGYSATGAPTGAPAGGVAGQSVAAAPSGTAAAPATASASAAAAPRDETDQAVADAYPSVSLSDIMFGKH